MVAKIPFRMSSLMTDAVLTPSAAARSWTTTVEPTSTGPSGRGRVAVSVLALASRLRFGGRGPRRFWVYLRGGMCLPR